jgi:hypothetical protein
LINTVGIGAALRHRPVDAYARAQSAEVKAQQTRKMAGTAVSRATAQAVLYWDNYQRVPLFRPTQT